MTFGVSNTVIGLPSDENCIILRLLVLTQYQHVIDGQTDARK